jgi:dethiobiotin synthetase
MATIFVTATDTDAGKTYVSAGLLRALRAAGVDAAGFKPVASGSEPDASGALRNADALALRAAAPTVVPYSATNPYCYAPAIAPHLAAADVSDAIDPHRLAAAHSALSRAHRLVLAEGAGGWLTPLSPQLRLGDWVAAQGWPVLLVVGLRLGAINHALLTAEAIRTRSPFLGWVANLGVAPMPRWQGNLAYLSEQLGPPLWCQAPHASTPTEAIPALKAAVSALGGGDFSALQLGLAANAP